MSHVADIDTADVGEQLRKRGCTTARFTDRQFCKLKVLSALRSEDKYMSHVDTADVGDQRVDYSEIHRQLNRIQGSQLSNTGYSYT